MSTLHATAVAAGGHRDLIINQLVFCLDERAQALHDHIADVSR
jgi:hypothetical protein